MTTTPAAQKIADRIKKLLALATSANPHEAAQAAAEAQRLMVEHDLSEACLEEGPGPVVEHVVQESDGSSRACMWRASLADKLGEAMGVKVLYTVGSSRLRSFGRSADVAAHAAIYHWLVAQLAPQCERDWYTMQRPDRAATTKGAFTRHWMHGASEVIVARMTESRRAAALATPDRGGTSAIVLLDRRREESSQAIERHFESIGMRVKVTRTTIRSAPGAREMGQAAGQRASITPNARTLTGRV